MISSIGVDSGKSSSPASSKAGSAPAANCTALIIVRLRSLLATVMLTGIYSFLGAGWMLLLDAPDVAFTEASVGAGISNWMTYYVNTDIHPFTRHYLKGTPWSDPEVYAKTSPMTHINDAVTPPGNASSALSSTLNPSSRVPSLR